MGPPVYKASLLTVESVDCLLPSRRRDWIVAGSGQLVFSVREAYAFASAKRDGAFRSPLI